MGSLAGRDIVAIGDLTRAEIEAVLAQAARFHEADRADAHRGKYARLLDGYRLATIFYEPSTRTRLSFESAMSRLGGDVLAVAEARTSSSAAKGETLQDTGRMLSGYADVIAMRHPEKGSARQMAEGAGIPVINGGDGTGEHPTQALLDLFTIREELGRLEGLTVTMLGDLKYGRTVHSLSRLLALYHAKLNYVSPEALRMPQHIVEELGKFGVEQTEYTGLEPVLAETDVLYVTRVQKERFEDLNVYESVKGAYVITPETMKGAKQDMVLMHPLPRVGEISMEVDDDPRAAYFRQMEYGLYVRMALLAMVLGKA